MPSASMSVTVENNLYLYFNDTLFDNVELSEEDVQLTVLGPNSPSSYKFDYELEFINDNTVFIRTEFQSTLNGNDQEQIVVRFINRDQFKSIFSLRGVNPEDVKGYLYEHQGSGTSSKSLGQTAMIVFLTSI